MPTFLRVCRVFGGQILERAHDVAVDGGSQEEEERAMASDDSVRGARLAAASSWRKYKCAAHLQATADRELQKAGPHDHYFLSASAVSLDPHYVLILSQSLWVVTLLAPLRVTGVCMVSTPS